MHFVTIAIPFGLNTTSAKQPIVQCEEVISIKKFLSQNNKESAEAYERMAHLLLQAMGLHAVEGDRTEYDRFRGSIAVLQSSLAEDPSPDNILITAGTAVKTLGDHNWHTSQYIRAKGIELQSIVGMLT